MPLPRSIFLAPLLATLGIVGAHHSPEEDAATLTAEMEAKGATAKLLYERATKWRALRKNDLALKDLREAIDLDPRFFLARREQAKILLQNGDLKSAKVAAEIAGKLAGEPLEQADAQMLLAEIHVASGAYTLAEKACDAAFASCPDHRRVDWYLRRSQAQRGLGHWKQCAAGLREGYHKTFSIVLYSQWVDSLIELGEHEKALTEINQQLPNLRFRATWLLRRAKAFLGQKRTEEAKADLKEALAELDQRIVPDREFPDVSLLAERGEVRFLLGNRKAAEADFDKARAAGADQWMLWSLKRALKR